MGLLLTKLHVPREESVESEEFAKYLKSSAIGNKLCDCSQDCEISKFNNRTATEKYAEKFESIKNGISLDSYARQSNNLTDIVEQFNEALRVDDSDESMYGSISSLSLQSTAALSSNQNCEMCSNYEECIAIMKVKSTAMFLRFWGVSCLKCGCESVRHLGLHLGLSVRHLGHLGCPSFTSRICNLCVSLQIA